MTGRGARRRIAALACLASCGCSTMKELPRDEYARLPERNNVRVETEAGEKYVFERIQVSADSLNGLRARISDTPFNEYDRTVMPLSSVRRMSVRSIDWYRTGLILGVGAAVGLAAVLSQSRNNNGNGDGGGGPCGPRPCP